VCQVFYDVLNAVFLDGLARDGGVHGTDAGKEYAQVIVNLCQRADGGACVGRNGALFDSDGGTQPVDAIDLGFFHALQELAGIAGEALHVSALSFRIEGVHHQRRLSRSREACDDHIGVFWYAYRYVL